MRRRCSLAALPLALLFLAAVAAPPAGAVLGATDRVLGASLIVPFFEAGIDPATNPEDTLLAIHNTSVIERTIHLQVWRRNGAPTGPAFNYTLASQETKSLSMRALINSVAPTLRQPVTEGAYYRGFVTIDLVSGPVSPGVIPLSVAYPAIWANLLEGYIYYTGMGGGTAGGLSMVPIEGAPVGTHGALVGFYHNSDRHEEIDREARSCAARLGLPGGSVASCDVPPLTRTATLRARYFKIPGLDSTTRVIIFAWDPVRAGQGGPSTICGANPHLGCPVQYTVRQYAENGIPEKAGTVLLLSAVNVLTLGGTSAGTLEISGVPNVDSRTQLYIFSINTAHPPGAPMINVFFEGYVD